MSDSNNGNHEGALERLDPAERRDHVATQHWARYEWAAQFLPRRRVLDCSCGVGYGSALLRQRGAASVVGVDVSAEAIAEAGRKYSRAGVEYLCADALTLDPNELGRFDLIVSLETIEHVGDPQGLLGVFQSLLEPDGLLALSCPNDSHLQGENPYHLWIADFDKLRSWIERRFRHVRCFGEVHVVGTSVCPMESLREQSGLEPLAVRLVDELPIRNTAGFLFLCGNQTLPAGEARGSLQLDGIGYIRELREVCDRLWQESRALSEENRRLAGEFENLRERDLDVAAERDRAQAESERLSRVWEEQRRRLGEIEAERDRIWADGRDLSRGYEQQAERISELEALIGRLTTELQEAQSEGRRLGKAWETQTAILHEAQDRLQAFQANVESLHRERDQLVQNLEQFRSQKVYRALRKVGLMKPAPEPGNLTARH